LAGHGHAEAAQLPARAVQQERLEGAGGHLVPLVDRIARIQRGVCGPVQDGRERVTDRGSDLGAAPRLHHFAASQSCHSPTLCSRSAQVAANFVSPSSVLTLTKYSQSPPGGSTAASRAPAPGAAIGPGGSPVRR